MRVSSRVTRASWSPPGDAHSSNETMPEAEKFTIVIVSERGPTPAVVRLRRLLKCLLRSFGFRCISVEKAGES